MLFLFAVFNSNAQVQKEPITEVPVVEETQEESVTDESWSVAPVFGVKMYKNLRIYEVGFQLANTVSEKGRIRFDLMYRKNSNGIDQSWGGYELNNKTDINALMVGVSYEYFPLKNSTISCLNFIKALKVRAGVFYVANPTYSFTSTISENEVLSWGDIAFTSEQIGALKTEISTQNIQPFLSLGYDRFFLNEHFNLIIEGGVNYHGTPRVNMSGTNLIAPTVEQAVLLQNNLKQYVVMPFLQLALQIKL
jgi:hypothetical protein